ncbi:MAG TPA: PD-(D/E)XK nuclease family protein [Acidimicrobiales bacterium]
MPHAAARTLADVLDRWSAGAGCEVDSGGAGEPDDRAGLDDLADALDGAARDATRLGGWTAGDPLRLSKAAVTWLLRCPRRALAGGATAATDDLVAGLAVDAAAKLATLVPRRPPTVEDALAYLRASDDVTAADHLADRGPAARPLLDDIAARIERLITAWPSLDPDWWPRVEEPVRVRLAGGAVTLGGRLDLLLGGPPTARPPVVVEVKGGRWHDNMRADGHLYALAVALRDGRPPAAVVTVVADGTTQVEPVRPAVLASAADRVVHALGVAAAIAGGEPPAAHAGPHCAHCPVQADCPAGRP